MLTEPQLQTLAAGIRSSTVPAVVAALAIRNDVALRDWCNASGTFIVWKSSVPAEEVGRAFDAAALDAMTAGNADKLSNFRNWNATIYPNRADHRAFFDGVFSVASGATTRAALLVLWKRALTNGERFFSPTGTGSDASPGQIGTYEGDISLDDVSNALNRY